MGGRVAKNGIVMYERESSVPCLSDIRTLLYHTYYIAVALDVSLQALLPMQETDRAARIRNARFLLDELEN